jgi:gamma-glutamylcyclotransferase (GGCT)/AIG2-like uncharacterized protein YtfP
MEQLPFFVYGTLKPGQGNYRRLLTGRTVSEVAASLPGAALYTEGPYPFLVWEDESTVQGVVITVPAAQYATMLRELDALEDYTPGNGDENLYERIACEVQTAQGLLRAWVYLAGSRAAARIASGGMHRVPDGNWV